MNIAHMSNDAHPQHADARVGELVDLAFELCQLAGLPPDCALLEACREIDDLLEFAEDWDAMSEAQARARGGKP